MVTLIPLTLLLVFQGDTLALYIIICLDYVLQISIDLKKENGIILKKKGQEADIILL